jgi:hypothetical protein
LLQGSWPFCTSLNIQVYFAILGFLFAGAADKSTQNKDQNLNKQGSNKEKHINHILHK